MPGSPVEGTPERRLQRSNACIEELLKAPRARTMRLIDTLRPAGVAMQRRKRRASAEDSAVAAPPEKSLLRTIVAMLPPLVALLVELSLWQLLHPSVWFLFYPAVFLSSWIGGLRAAVAASLFAAVAALWFLVPPERTFADLAPGQWLAAGVFLMTGVVFGIFHDRLRKASARSARALGAAEWANYRLKRASEAIASLLEQAPDGIFVANLDGRFTEVNDAGCRMLGYTRDEIIGKTMADLVPAERVDELRREGKRAREEGRALSEWTLRRKDGTYLPVEVSARVLSDGRWQGFVRDVSTRRRLEEALRASYADLNRAQSVAGVGSWRLDVRRDELVWSDESYRIFGVSPGTPMSYEGFLACVHPDDRAWVHDAWTAALAGEPYDIEHRVVADGRIKWVREKAELEFDANRKLIGGIGITHDITPRKEQEEALRNAQERFELALRGADLGAWDWNIETGEVVFNPRWAEMRGYRPDEIRGHVDEWISGVHPEDLPRLRKVLDDYLRGRTSEYEVEHRARTKSGEWIWILDRGKIFARDERGQPIRMAGTELDITARKRVEEELRLAQAKASGIIAISADAIIAVDDGQRITLFNEGAERMFGYSAAEAIGAPLDMLIPERLRAVHRHHLARFAAGPQAARRMGDRGAVIIGLRKSGEEFPADAAISKMNVDGTAMLTVSVRDITEQKRLEREHELLAEVGAVFASTLEYEETLGTIARLLVRELADFCIVDVVVDGEVQRQRVESRDPEKAWICDLFREITLDRSKPHLMRAALETRRPVLMEHLSPDAIPSLAQSEEHLRALRALDPKSVLAVPLLAHGKLLGALALISSTESRQYRESDLRLAEELAVRAALAIENARLYRLAMGAIQARDDVVGIVAHDLRNPLGAIVMQAALLQRSEAEPERGSRAPGEVIARAALRMERLINDLLEVTSIEAGSFRVEPARVSAASVISDAVEAQKMLASPASIQIACDAAPALPDVWGDRDRLLQVLENLVGNAIKFTKPGGCITIGARRRDAEVVFSVADTGAGIPAEALPHVFDRFWQARRAKRRGVGLGLAIVKGIVEAHGGRVWVESTPGRGTTFFFTVPAAPQREEWRSEGASRGT